MHCLATETVHPNKIVQYEVGGEKFKIFLTKHPQILLSGLQVSVQQGQNMLEY